MSAMLTQEIAATAARLVVEDGMGNTYRTSKLQTDFIGF